MSAIGMALGKALIPAILGQLTKGKGKVTKQIVEVALEATGMAEGSSEKDILEVLKKDPAAYAAVQAQAASLAIEEISAELKLKEFEFNDRRSAREMHLETKDPILHKLVWISLVFLIGAFMAVMGLIVLSSYYDFEIDTVWIALVSTMVGNASARFDQVFHFFLGSSQGSKDKDLPLSKLAGRE